jgi:DNA-binding transcriptional regulator of glucitol operon
MGMGTFFIVLALAWMAQIYLAWRQAQRFMARVRVLRRSGKVAIGSSGSRLRGRAYVVLAVGPDDRVTAAETLKGTTVFAGTRPLPALVGRTAADLAAGDDLPELHTRVREAATSSAAMFHPRPGGTAPHPLALPDPWYRRLLRPRGGAARA